MSVETRFNKNIGKKIRAEVFTDQLKKEKTNNSYQTAIDSLSFEGVITELICNTFIIETEKGIEIFRWEDIRNLQVL